MYKTSLKYHVRVSHSASGKKFKCKFCDKTFLHTLPLKRHIKSMYSEDLGIYQCDECYKTFRRNDYLTVQRRLVNKTLKVSINMVNMSGKSF
jgi:ribosomal protein L37AE/L43A